MGGVQCISCIGSTGSGGARIEKLSSLVWVHPQGAAGQGIWVSGLDFKLIQTLVILQRYDDMQACRFIQATGCVPCRILSGD